MIRCPYCLEETDPKLDHQDSRTGYKCSKCNAIIHRDFVEKQSIPRTTVGVVGFTGHGKTVYITSLFYMLKEFENLWKKYYLITLDENTHPILYQRVPTFKQQSLLPDGTPANFPHPALIQFNHIPIFGDFFLSFYDIGGGVFEQMQSITQQGKFVAYSDTVLFILSIHDLKENWQDQIRGLLDRYIGAVYDWMRIELKERQHLVVVLTKADTLVDNTLERKLSKELEEYLFSGTYKEYLYLKNNNYMKKLKVYSKKIKEWLIENRCKGFVTAAEENFKSVEYALVSAIGGAPNGKQLVKKLALSDPKRVLDPFLWLLEKNRPKGLFRNVFGG